MENKINKKKTSQLITKFEIESKLDMLVEGQTNNSKQFKEIRDDLQKGFVGLAIHNQELFRTNKKLEEQLELITEEFNQIKKKRKEKEIRKQARANRKRLPKREPMTREIYNALIKAAEGPAYKNVRIRLAIYLLAVTGIRINELLLLKVGQLKTLLEENWITLDRSKRGPINHKAFLNKNGWKIIQDRKKDFDFLF